ncbi:hypothetical protein E2C01_046147 [Portunus trituberculatus]|uniref:Secreted protein n=1 Tax=Portunus trituberculatus TaxID=210409 RepID=A0A5B7G4T6_PORTR|nr:hypothetical protein [Portunus trituberculatus]
MIRRALEGVLLSLLYPWQAQEHADPSRLGAGHQFDRLKVTDGQFFECGIACSGGSFIAGEEGRKGRNETVEVGDCNSSKHGFWKE